MPEAMQDSVNPTDFDWYAASRGLNLSDLRTTWEKMLVTEIPHSDSTKKIGNLNDDLQVLFVSLLLEHADDVFQCWEAKKQPKPLHLFLLGTAGTGKTTATQTALQELQNKLTETGLTHHFIRVAAPTGSAAFNVRFNATTVHRLIRWFNPRFFDELKDPERLKDLQEHFSQTQILLFDEVSMIGRKMMGRIASRMEQAIALENPHHELCGGLSLVCVGDPAQCQAIFDLSLIHI